MQRSLARRILSDILLARQFEQAAAEQLGAGLSGASCT
jgi:hypothetical protein